MPHGQLRLEPSAMQLPTPPTRVVGEPRQLVRHLLRREPHVEVLAGVPPPTHPVHRHLELLGMQPRGVLQCMGAGGGSDPTSSAPPPSAPRHAAAVCWMAVGRARGVGSDHWRQAVGAEALNASVPALPCSPPLPCCHNPPWAEPSSLGPPEHTPAGDERGRAFSGHQGRGEGGVHAKNAGAGKAGEPAVGPNNQAHTHTDTPAR